MNHDLEKEDTSLNLLERERQMMTYFLKNQTPLEITYRYFPTSSSSYKERQRMKCNDSIGAANFHMLKIAPEHFADIVHHNKRFETRINDRHFKLWDYLLLQEWENGKFTSNFLLVQINFISSAMQRENHVCMGFTFVN